MPTHIDYHGSFENYVAAKWNLQKNMTEKDVIVLNFNQDLAKELATKTKARVLPFSTVEKVDGAYLEDGLLKFKGEVVMRTDELGVPGSHNVENALATIAVVQKSVGVENEVIKETLSAFGVSNTAFNMWMRFKVSNSIMTVNRLIFLATQKKLFLVLITAR